MDVESSFLFCFCPEFVFGIVFKGCFISKLFVLEGFIIKGVPKGWFAFVAFPQRDGKVARVVDFHQEVVFFVGMEHKWELMVVRQENNFLMVDSD